MSGSDKDLFMIMVMFGPWGAYALLVCGTKRKVNKTVRQLAVSGADVEVRFGLCQAGAELALALRTDLIAHLGCEEEKVQVEDFSTTLAAGVRVVVHTEGEHNGAHGAVVKKTGGEVGATTSTVGAEVVYEVKLDDTSMKETFTRKQLRARPHVVGAAADAPAAVYVVTAEWAGRPEFLGEIVMSLAARAGMDLSSIRGDGTIQDCLLGRSHAELAGLRAGVFLFVAGDFDLEAPAYKRLTNPEGLGLAAVMSQEAASHGGQNPHAQMLAAVSAFLAKERRSKAYTERREEFAEAAGGAHSTISDIMENKEAFAQAATRTAALLRVSLPHVQMVSFTWSLDISWPTGIQRLRDTVGSVLQVNAMATANPACGLDDASRGTRSGIFITLALVYIVVFTCIFSFGHYLCCARIQRISSKLTPDLKARQLEIRRTTNVRTVLTLYTLMFPVMIAHVTKMGDWKQADDGEWFNSHIGQLPEGAGRDINPFPSCPRRCVEEWVGFFRVVAALMYLALAVAVPLVLFFFMHRAKRRGLFQTAKTQARLGWLYQAYKEQYFYFELINILCRAAIIIATVLLDNLSTIAVMTFNLAVLGCQLGLQLWLKPFAENTKAASISSINNHAAFALGCQVVNVGLALITEATKAGEDGDGDDLGSWAIVVCGLAVFLAPILFSLPDDIQAWYGAIKGVPRLVKDTVALAAEKLDGDETANPVADPDGAEFEIEKGSE
jgi:hypothetical protein